MDFLGRVARRQIETQLTLRTRATNPGAAHEPPWPLEAADAEASPAEAGRPAQPLPPAARVGRLHVAPDPRSPAAHSGPPAAAPRVPGAAAATPPKPAGSIARPLRDRPVTASSEAPSAAGSGTRPDLPTSGRSTSEASAGEQRPPTLSVEPHAVTAKPPADEAADDESLFAHPRRDSASDVPATRPASVRLTRSEQRAAAQPAREDVTVTVTIGRLEVRGTPEARSPKSLPVVPSRPGLSLEDYLERRHGAAR